MNDKTRTDRLAAYLQKIVVRRREPLHIVLSAAEYDQLADRIESEAAGEEPMRQQLLGAELIVLPKAVTFQGI